jgi:electron transfer flavoprotein beta subunit
MRCRGNTRVPGSECNTGSDKESTLRIIVCLKQVVDLAQVRFKSDGRTPVLEGLPVKLGAFEKNALEEAIRIKERMTDVEVVALSVGSGKLKESIKEALAMGADRAVLVYDGVLAELGSDAVARLLASAISRIGDWDLCMLGEGSDDEYTGQIPSRLAAILDVPQITNVREMEIDADGRVRATRDLEQELEIVACPPPVVLSVTSELNTPRLPPLTAILKAGRKPIDVWSLAELGFEPGELRPETPQVEVLSNLAPQGSHRNRVLEGDLDAQIGELIQALEHDGVLS